MSQKSNMHVGGGVGRLFVPKSRRCSIIGVRGLDIDAVFQFTRVIVGFNPGQVYDGITVEISPLQLRIGLPFRLKSSARDRPGIADWRREDRGLSVFAEL